MLNRERITTRTSNGLRVTTHEMTVSQTGVTYLQPAQQNFRPPTAVGRRRPVTHRRFKRMQLIKLLFMHARKIANIGGRNYEGGANNRNEANEADVEAKQKHA